MSDFYVGQKVVCVDDYNTDADGKRELMKGQIYTVRAFARTGWQEPCLFLVGFYRPRYVGGTGPDTPFAIRRFRPLEYKAMQIFRAIAANPTTNIREDA